jgi:hypothetical protein
MRNDRTGGHSALRRTIQPESISGKRAQEMSGNEGATTHFQPPTHQANFEYWAKLTRWTEAQAAALLLGVNPNRAEMRGRIDYSFSDALDREYAGLLGLTTNASFNGPVIRNTPQEWIAWAVHMELPVPSILSAAVTKFAPPPSQKEPPEVEVAKDELDPRERASLLKLVAGLAWSAYRFDPSAKRSTVVPELHNECLNLGIEISDDTIRRLLGEAAQYLQKPPKDAS